MQNVEVIFLDESSSDPWEMKRKTWLNMEDKFKLDLTPNMTGDKKRV